MFCLCISALQLCLTRAASIWGATCLPSWRRHPIDPEGSQITVVFYRIQWWKKWGDSFSVQCLYYIVLILHFPKILCEWNIRNYYPSHTIGNICSCGLALGINLISFHGTPWCFAAELLKGLMANKGAKQKLLVVLIMNVWNCHRNANARRLPCDRCILFLVFVAAFRLTSYSNVSFKLIFFLYLVP